MVLGFGKWLVKEGSKKVLKDKTKTITIRPGIKFKGQKTVGEIKADMKLKKAKIKLDQTLTKTEKSLKKLTETTKKNQKSLRDYLLNK